MTTDGQVLILHVLWKTVLSAKQCLLTKFWSSILCQQEECWLFNWLIKTLFFHFPLVTFHWVLLCCWFSRTRISAQFIVGFSPLSGNIALWKNVKILPLQMVSWSRDRRYLAAVTQRIWTRTRHMPYFPRLLFQPLQDYSVIPLWVG